MPILIEGIQYTKEEVYKKISTFLKDNPIGTVVNKKEDIYRYLNWCRLQRGKSVSTKAPKIKIIPSRNYKCFAYYNSSTRDWVDFSFKKALMGDDKELIQNIQKAFRNEVYGFIKSFRDSALLKNPELSKLSDKNPCLVHTDHVIPFHLLLSNFLQDKELKLPDVSIVRTDHRFLEYQLKDRGLASEWQFFHNKHCKLKLITAEDNYKKANSYDLPLFHYSKNIGKSYMNIE